MRIGLVSESPRDADWLRTAVALAPEHQVIWIGRTGAEAVDLCAHQTPHLILMGLLPGEDGATVTRRIMATAPCAILIVTSSVRLNAARVFEAMGQGAIDVVEMPAATIGNLREFAAPLLAKLAAVALLVCEKDAAASAPASRDRTTSPHEHPLVAIGASAGGPAALAAVLRGLPRDFPAAIVVVQHLDAQFLGGMADWLSHQSPVPVRVAKEGERPASGCVLLAGTSDHLVLTGASRLGYVAEPRHYIHRPSIDVLFESIVRKWPGDAVGVLLTGMGRDGALGLKSLRDTGHHTIAQDQASSTVYGMPKAAATLKAAVDILPMDRIAARLIDVVQERLAAPGPARATDSTPGGRHRHSQR